MNARQYLFVVGCAVFFSHASFGVASMNSAEDLRPAPVISLNKNDFNGQGLWNGSAGWVSWCLESTVGLEGFIVFRVEEETGEEICLNQTLIPVDMYDLDERYGVQDPDAVEGGNGRYRLEAVTFAGEAQDLGFATVTFDAVPAMHLPQKMSPPWGRVFCAD